MPAFTVRHASTYAYSGPVTLSPHALYVRPRGDHRMKVVSSSLTLSPPAELVWRNDMYGNSVAIARFAGEVTQLDVISDLEVETFPRSEDQRYDDGGIDHDDGRSGAGSWSACAASRRSRQSAVRRASGSRRWRRR